MQTLNNMCGIFGTISRKTRPFNKRAFCTMGVRNDSRGGDSCGVFIDGNVEYGVDKQKLFINFFRDSLLLDTTIECKVALGHCRKASVGKVSVETAQPVIIYNENKEVDYVLIHNGTIYNYKELAKKYIPDINIDDLTDSQVMARIFYHTGYEALDEYYGGAVFVIHDYRINQSFVFKGKSKKYTHSKEVEEERPLFYCWHNGRFCFSSIFESLYAFYYEETIYTLSPNKLLNIRTDKFKLVKEYKREKVSQSKPVSIITTSNIYTNPVYNDEYDDWNDGCSIVRTNINQEYRCFKIKFDGWSYVNDANLPMHGIYLLSSYGYVYPNKKTKNEWMYEVGFFMGRMLKHPDAFKLLDAKYKAANKILTKEIDTLLNMMDFNPFTNDMVQYFWFENTTLMIPQGEWKFPMADWSLVFDQEGKAIESGKKAYNGWVTDYNMYTYVESEILEKLKELCVEV